jgi:Cytochrome C oxidase, cbb3-type, subunit III
MERKAAMGSPPHRNTLGLPAALLLLSLVAACGGDRSRAPGAGDTTGATAVTPDSAATPSSDSAAPSGTASTSDTAANASAAPTPAAKAPAPETTAKPAAPPAVKAAAKPKPTQTAAAPSPAAPAAAPQDTSKEAAAKPTTQAGDQPLRDAYHQAPKDTVTQAVYNGWKQFNLNCARCHGEDVLGTTIAPHLIVSLKPDGPINSKELFMQTVCAGRPAKGMPAWCALGLGMDKIDEIYQYVKGRSDAKISPGRPAVKEQG